MTLVLVTLGTLLYPEKWVNNFVTIQLCWGRGGKSFESKSKRGAWTGPSPAPLRGTLLRLFLGTLPVSQSQGTVFFPRCWR